MPPAEPTRPVRVRVPAKVNLHLGVGAVREDGYHELVTVFQAVDLVDEITARAAEHLEVRVTGEGADTVPAGAQNLAWQAAALLAEHTRLAPLVRLDISKAIPVAGGMAGGSADAAAALLACATLWGTGTDRDELAVLAAELGSDVAFPLLGGTALGTGRGELLTPVLTTGVYHWVFALADFGISAGDAYAELDRLRAAGTAPEPAGSPDALLDALRGGEPAAVAAHLANDLQAAAVSLAPQLQRTLDAGHDLGALTGLVSGSGPTVAFLCSDGDHAATLAAALEAGGVCHTTRVATGAAHGARVVLP